jgi:purine catabolism regulator
MAAGRLAETLAELIRTAGTTGTKTGYVLSAGVDGLPELRPIIEPLQINGETVGGLIIFPPPEGVDDFDEVLIHAARLALDVQLLREYVRFRSEANSVAELFKALFAGLPQRPADVLAKATRLGVSLGGPARLVTIGFAIDLPDAAEAQFASLHLALARRAADFLPGAAVIRDDQLVVFAPIPVRKDAPAWQKFLRYLTSTIEAHVGVQPILAESSICQQLQDYREARLECNRVITLARMFGKAGRFSQKDFGPFALLLSTINHASAREFVQDALGAIEEYDRAHGTELVLTVREFLREGCRYQSCAARMGIHVSTLRYRLERLHELFGIKLQEPDVMFGLGLALRLRELEGEAPQRRLQ